MLDISRLPSGLRTSVFSSCRLVPTTFRTYTTHRQAKSQDGTAALESLALKRSPATSPLNLGSYVVSTPPSSLSLRHATSTFTSLLPRPLFEATIFRDLPPSPFPEVALLGRANVGKSSLLNALFNRTRAKVVNVGRRPGSTRSMIGVGAGAPLSPFVKRGTTGKKIKDQLWKRFGLGGFVVVDMPGYQALSEKLYDTEAFKYLEQRRQLQRIFVVIDSSHGLKRSDISLLLHLRQLGLRFQVILSKVDTILYTGKEVLDPRARLMKLQDACDRCREQFEAEAGNVPGGPLGDILCCSTAMTKDSNGKAIRTGIEEIRWAIVNACGIEYDERGQRIRAIVDELS